MLFLQEDKDVFLLLPCCSLQVGGKEGTAHFYFSILCSFSYLFLLLHSAIICIAAVSQHTFFKTRTRSFPPQTESWNQGDILQGECSCLRFDLHSQMLWAHGMECPEIVMDCNIYIWNIYIWYIYICSLASNLMAFWYFEGARYKFIELILAAKISYIV